MTLTVISLGAGVQSTTMALMAAKGEITPMPDCAIFADTGWEPKAVYEHLERLIAALPFPVHIVTCGKNIRHNLVANNGRHVRSIPWFTTKGGMGIRQCTNAYKLEPLGRKVRELLGYSKGDRVHAGVSAEVWIGISWDEKIRMKNSYNKWQVNRWPLVEKEMRRHQCIEWLAAHGWEAPKSSCLGCPFHSDAQWRELKNGPEWSDIVAADRELRSGVTGKSQLDYMHRSCKPIDEVDLLTPEDHGQLSFLGECDGMCGV